MVFKALANVNVTFQMLFGEFVGVLLLQRLVTERNILINLKNNICCLRRNILKITLSRKYSFSISQNLIFFNSRNKWINFIGFYHCQC